MVSALKERKEKEAVTEQEDGLKRWTFQIPWVDKKE